MVLRHEFAFRSRRFAADVLLGIAALFLAIAAFTATTDPSLLLILAFVIGIALVVEPANAGFNPRGQARSRVKPEATPVRG